MTDFKTTKSENERYCHMEVTCPHCGGQALVPWAHLDKVLRCNACAAWCRLDRFGKPYEASAPNGFWVQVRSSFARWERARVLLGAPQDAGVLESLKANWRFSVAGALLGLACIVGIRHVVTRPSARPPSMAEPQQAPDSLEGRAAWWADAWWADDTTRLLLLVEPSRDRHLRRWLAKHRSPRLVDEAQAERPQVELSVKLRSERHLADVKILIARSQRAELRETIELRQLWHQRDGVWYFWPEL